MTRLRDAGRKVGLHIIGSGSGDYASYMSRLITDKPWVTWHQGLDRDALEALVVQQKWGLHTCIAEHYGFAPAELQALGCITFVHDSGGQREIIANPQQRYSDTADAVRKIAAVLDAPQDHLDLVRASEDAAASHTVEVFRQRFLALVDEIMAKESGECAG